MSDGITTQVFDGQPFGHRWSNPPRPGLAYDTPPDPPRFQVGECPCCREWFEVRDRRVVGHLDDGVLCRGSGLRATDLDVS